MKKRLRLFLFVRKLYRSALHQFFQMILVRLHHCHDLIKDVSLPVMKILNMRMTKLTRICTGIVTLHVLTFIGIQAIDAWRKLERKIP